MSTLDYWYEKVANELLRKMLRQFNSTDWTIDELYNLVKKTGELDASKYTLVKNDPIDIKVEVSVKK